MGSRGGGGGGGGSGQISYPQYMQDFHESNLAIVGDYAQAAIALNPYATAQVFDPEETITDMIERVDEYKQAVDDLDSITSLTDAINTIRGSLEEIDEVAIAETVAHYENSQIGQHQRSVSRFAGQMASINAVMSSAFVFGLAQLETEYQRDISRFENSMRLQLADRREGLAANLAPVALQATMSRLTGLRDYVAMSVEIGRMQVVAYKEALEQDANYDVQAAIWPMEMLKYGHNALAGIGGAVSDTQGNQPNRLATMLGGALSGAAAGGQMGLTLGGGNPAVAGIGAVVGGIVGIIGNR